MTTTYDDEARTQVPHMTDADLMAERDMARLERDALRRDIEDLKRRVIAFTRDGIHMAHDKGWDEFQSLLGEHEFPLSIHRIEDGSIPGWLVPEPTDLDWVRDEWGQAEKELDVLYAWRTRAVNMCHRAARHCDWCSSFDEFMVNVGLPARESYGHPVPPGWYEDDGRWHFDPARLSPLTLDVPDDETEEQQLIRLRDEARTRVRTIERWRDGHLTECAHRTGGTQAQYNRLMRLCGIKQREEYTLIPGEFGEDEEGNDE